MCIHLLAVGKAASVLHSKGTEAPNLLGAQAQEKALQLRLALPCQGASEESCAGAFRRFDLSRA